VNVDERVRRLAIGWADYRRRQWTAGLLTLGFVPLAGLIAVTMENFTQSERFIIVPETAFMIIVVWSWSRFIYFRCPFCSRCFHLTAVCRLTSGRRCPHCGLERYQAD